MKTEISSLESQLPSLTTLEIEGVKVRSRAQWLEEGEKPSRFFFKLEQRSEKNLVSSIYDTNGSVVSSHVDLEKVHVAFYRMRRS